jgi:ribosome-binding factor A
MKSPRMSPKQKRLLSSELGPEDGIDPRFEERSGRSRKGKRKLLQLCKEAERTLSAVLAGECGDDLLRDLAILSVVPFPHAGRLLVTVDLPTPGVSAEKIKVHLARATGMLRAAVAAAVRRRRVPELVFQFNWGKTNP